MVKLHVLRSTVPFVSYDVKSNAQIVVQKEHSSVHSSLLINMSLSLICMEYLPLDVDGIIFYFFNKKKEAFSTKQGFKYKFYENLDNYRYSFIDQFNLFPNNMQ